MLQNDVPAINILDSAFGDEIAQFRCASVIFLSAELLALFLSDFNALFALRILEI